jgi:hypothetical protein
VVVVSTTDLRARRAPFWWCRQPCRHRPEPCYAQMPPSSIEQPPVDAMSPR